ncbi:Enoyl-CoA hydratase, mitochondrial [Neolecta irregularis DAH-3]|uniref:Enoyl-CoA hydratase, mitochondrial n=1 Tax=Neolecta irregularis (strain DAH-3) TaxID=1198029 RepID=A0A1U7LQ64_NEOID|nr:Enoyl-CoA hydratase, mitochondrial [Neolecta irregularis DAH-3]|eukprot:OLL24661.1 Enoyl-CoA hydratase, mitochondrial [Neolecta irregularis DAH-3]
MFTTTRASISRLSKRMFSAIQTSLPSKAVARITLSRPPVNALNSALFTELNAALREYAADPSIKVVLLTGSKKAFAAGADIKEMSNLSFADAYGKEFISHWSEMMNFSKPVVAAVRGFTLGGGCELAMM